MRIFIATWALLFLCTSRGAGAEVPVDRDLDLAAIPKAVLNAPPPKATRAPDSRAEARVFLESALTGWKNRNDLLVPAPNPQPGDQERLSIDGSYEWKATNTLRFGFSDRLSAFAGDTISWPSSGSLRNDLREAFASCEVASQTFVEVGRINLKNGPALGYNPTDFFKPRAQVSLASIDPSAAKQNRLGVLMVQGQKLFDGGAFTVAFAPEVQHPSRLLTSAPASFDPLLGQTNASVRCLGSLSYDLMGLSPQVLVFHDDVGTHFGASLSHVVSKRVVVYAEWSGVDEGSLARRAIAFGRATGSLPADAPRPLQSSTPTHYQNDVAVGASWTGRHRVTVNLEFHYHQSGFTRDDFDRWITVGNSDRQLADEMWFIRTYAMDQQEPLMRQQIFLRLDWQDALVRYLDLGLVSFVNPFDRSVLAQLSAQYALSSHWTLGIYATGSFGGANREKGSLPWSRNAVLQIVRFW
jgi:hypothetical protein